MAEEMWPRLLAQAWAALDLGTRDGTAQLHELLSGADILVHGYRPHALDRFGLTPDKLAERHPGLTTVRPPGELGGNRYAWPGTLSRYGGDQAAWP